MAGRAVHDAAQAARAAWERGDVPEATVQYRPAATTPLDRETGAGTPNYCYEMCIRDRLRSACVAWG